ncbi:MAG: hypothetical protein AB3N33_06210 [Puniceicoccaceae bacterium]
MAGSVGMGPSGRQRVFVLVDKGTAQGVFTSWEAAETYADEHKFSLDRLMEYVTRSDHPDHLHLMAAQWEGDWQFQGEWTKQAPKWQKPPRKVRLDHYHAKGGGFQLLRQKEFTWESGLLWKVNPMAPEEALKTDLSSTTGVSKTSSEQKPSLAPLKSIEPGSKTADQPAEKEASDSESQEAIRKPPAGPAGPTLSPAGIGAEDRPPPPGQKPSKSLVTEPEPPIDEQPSAPASGKDSPQAPKKQKLTTVEPGQKPKKPAKDEAKAPKKGEPSKSRITFQKKSPLRLKSKGAPEPIPSFKPAVAVPDIAGGGQSSVEMAQQQQEARRKEAEEKEKAEMKVRRVWSIRLILTMVFIITCWSAGVLYVFRPEPTAANILMEVSSLNSARKKIMEPEMVFFQLPVDPVHQDRWIQSLQLQPLREGQVISIPTYHAFDTWEKPSGFIRPPYSETEIDEWWDLRLREIRYGFVHRWEDGTILILDLESDSMIGWAKAKNLPEILN